MDLVTPELGIIFWQAVTLLCVLIVLKKFGWQPMINILQKREANIERDLYAAYEARKIIAEVKTQQKLLIEEANVQREKIIRDAEIAKAAILEEAKLEAQQLSQRMLKQTRLMLEKEQEAATEKLKSQAIELSIQIAEKLLRKELETQNKQEMLIQELLKKPHFN